MKQFFPILDECGFQNGEIFLLFALLPALKIVTCWSIYSIMTIKQQILVYNLNSWCYQNMLHSKVQKSAVTLQFRWSKYKHSKMFLPLFLHNAVTATFPGLKVQGLTNLCLWKTKSMVELITEVKKKSSLLFSAEDLFQCLTSARIFVARETGGFLKKMYWSRIYFHIDNLQHPH